LYAGAPNKSPLFVHALIVNHYIESSWKFVDGGSQIARYLAKEITNLGGKVINHVDVVKLKEENGRVIYAEDAKGERFYGDLFISNVTPTKTIEMTESNMFKNAFRSRLKSLESTISTFYANVVMKKNSFKYMNSNIYCFEQEDPWCVGRYTDDTWPQGICIVFRCVIKIHRVRRGCYRNDLYADG
jgi:all-trans-retinol 13,14-reductase